MPPHTESYHIDFILGGWRSTTRAN